MPDGRNVNADCGQAATRHLPQHGVNGLAFAEVGDVKGAAFGHIIVVRRDAQGLINSGVRVA